jgi:hypothetical protein
MVNQMATLHYKHDLQEKELHIQDVPFTVSLRTVAVTADAHFLLDKASEPRDRTKEAFCASLNLQRLNVSVLNRDSVRRPRLKCDGTRAETRFRLSAKRTSQFKSTGASVQSTTGSRGVSISGSNAGYIMFPGSVKSTG